MKLSFYEQFRRDIHSSEYQHLSQINDLVEKISFERFKQTPQEKIELKKRMLNYPNRNGAPIPPNN